MIYLENTEEIPKEGKTLQFHHFNFTIEKINKKRIISIKTKINNEN